VDWPHHLPDAGFALATAKERAERLLSDAQATIKDLQTKLGHERLAKDEAIARAEANRESMDQVLQSVRSELAAEKIARERSDQALRNAQVTISDLTAKLHLAQQSGRRIGAELAARTAQETGGRQPEGDRRGTINTVRKPRGRPRKATVVQTVEKSVRQPRPKPIKWWLGNRSSLRPRLTTRSPNRIVEARQSA
jgi:hypothetical protein